uniref:hypothetical protein n=1 Tax=Ruminococcus callidus TaxID=40519 RepID=UPI003FD6EA79
DEKFDDASAAQSLCGIALTQKSVEQGSFTLFAAGGESAHRPAEMATADLPKDSKPPLTLRPDCPRSYIARKNPSTSFAGPPPLSGEAFYSASLHELGSPERAPEGRALC